MISACCFNWIRFALGGLVCRTRRGFFFIIHLAAFLASESSNSLTGRIKLSEPRGCVTSILVDDSRRIARKSNRFISHLIALSAPKIDPKLCDHLVDLLISYQTSKFAFLPI